MKKSIAVIVFFGLVTVAHAENSVPNYGYWENSNEISAKKDLISTVNPKYIFDDNVSPNQNGEQIVNGKYYIPVMYNGGNNGTDTDYIYVSDLKGAKGDQGIQGVQGNTGATGATGATGQKGDTGSQGVQGIQGVKGEKGTTGSTGAQGVAGSQGIQGVSGHDGNNGTNGINGTNGVNGPAGTNGVDGKDGLNGQDGANGTNGVDGATGPQGDKGDKGDKGNDGAGVNPNLLNGLASSTTANGISVNDLNNRITNLERTQYIIGAVIRIHDSRKWQINAFIDYSATRNKVSSTGIRFTYKIGKSYEEARLDELEAKILKLTHSQEEPARQASSQVYSTGNGLGIRTSF